MRYSHFPLSCLQIQHTKHKHAEIQLYRITVVQPSDDHPFSTGSAAQRIPSSAPPSYPLHPHWTKYSKPCSNQQQRSPAFLLAVACTRFVEGSRSWRLPGRSDSRMLGEALPTPEVGSRHTMMTWIEKSVSCGKSLMMYGGLARVAPVSIGKKSHSPMVGKLGK